MTFNLPVISSTIKLNIARNLTQIKTSKYFSEVEYSNQCELWMALTAFSNIPK